MKKVLVLILGLVVLMTASLGVFASEDEFESNMDAETYLELRLAQIDEALAEGKITEEQADLLREHVEEVAADESFGNCPIYGERGDGDVECILGDGLNLGIFRSESAGQRSGAGNGVRVYNRGRGNCCNN